MTQNLKAIKGKIYTFFFKRFCTTTKISYKVKKMASRETITMNIIDKRLIFQIYENLKLRRKRLTTKFKIKYMNQQPKTFY